MKDDKDDSKGEPDKKDDTEKSKKTPVESSSKEETPEADKGEEELVEVEDDDDYLLYLEVILRTIHTAYYDLYDQMREEKDSPSTSSSSSSSVPDLKTVIPYVKRKVILPCQILVPQSHLITITPGSTRNERGVQRRGSDPRAAQQEPGL